MWGDRLGEDHEADNQVSGTVHGAVVQVGTVHGDIHLAAGPPTAPRVPGPGHPADDASPWQLPSVPPLTDRAAELAALERHHRTALEHRSGTLAAISGLGGVGKTALALTWLHGLCPAFPGGQLYADLGGQSPAGAGDPAEVLSRFLRGLGVPGSRIPRAVEERASLYRSLTARRPLVVLLDDAATAAQVRTLLPGGTSVTAVTGRARLPGLSVDGCCQIHLEPLGVEDAVALLDATVADERVRTQWKDARALVRLCAGLPLAVRVAGARLAARPARRITTLVRALEKEHSRLQALTIEGDRTVQAALDCSYATLRADAARLYRLLALHPTAEFGTGVAAAVLGGPGGAPDTATVVGLLDALHDASLLADAPQPASGRSDGDGEGPEPGGPAGEWDGTEERHRFHDLVRLHALAKAEALDPPQERRAALRRILGFYLSTATEAESLIEPQHRTLPRDLGPDPVTPADLGGDPGRALDWLEHELPNLMAVLRTARADGWPEVTWQLADAMWPLFLRRKHYEQWRAAHREGLAAATAAGDAAAQCRMLTSGGIGELDMGAGEQALEMFERAAALCERLGDRLGYARTLNYRGLAHRQSGRPERAGELFARAAAQLPALGDERAGALAVLNLADSHLDACASATSGTAVHGRDDSAVVAPADSRDAVRALEHAQAAHRVLAGKGDVYNAARAAIAAGRACLALGRMGEAEEQLSGALGVLRGMNADFEAARALGALAALAERQGRARLAAEHGRAALRLHEGLSGTESAQARQVRALLARLPGENEDRAAPGGHGETSDRGDAAPGGHAPASDGHAPASGGHDAAPEEQ
ncbi:tetratricopeptide repeat protein [Streptomyces sp. enrichment culture]|uniref:tetratricopeptide repeat protein n=1 Tax=Streptomyces sp. enrichment culture TaxID=1795815 RepID=UPI003F5764D2